MTDIYNVNSLKNLNYPKYYLLLNDYDWQT